MTFPPKSPRALPGRRAAKGSHMSSQRVSSVRAAKPSIPALIIKRQSVRKAATHGIMMSGCEESAAARSKSAGGAPPGVSVPLLPPPRRPAAVAALRSPSSAGHPRGALAALAPPLPSPSRTHCILLQLRTRARGWRGGGGENRGRGPVSPPPSSSLFTGRWGRAGEAPPAVNPLCPARPTLAALSFSLTRETEREVERDR